MAGQPKRRAMIEDLERRTREYFEIDDVDVAIGAQTIPSHLDYVAAFIRDGHTLKELAFEIGTTLGYEIGRERVSAYLRATWTTADEILAAARAHASHPMAERALEVVGAHADDSIDVAKAASQARVLLKIAESYDPQSFGSHKGTNVSISITSLHLDALRAGAFVPKTVTGSVESITHNAAIDGAEQAQAHAIASLSQHDS